MSRVRFWDAAFKHKLLYRPSKIHILHPFISSLKSITCAFLNDSYEKISSFPSALTRLYFSVCLFTLFVFPITPKQSVCVGRA